MDTVSRLIRLARPEGSVDVRCLPARGGIPEGGRLGRAQDLPHTYVRCWLNGMVPRDSETRNAISDALAGTA